MPSETKRLGKKYKVGAEFITATKRMTKDRPVNQMEIQSKVLGAAQDKWTALTNVMQLLIIRERIAKSYLNVTSASQGGEKQKDAYYKSILNYNEQIKILLSL